MNNRYVLTLAAIEARLYTDEADSVFMRWPTAEKELPSGNHTPGGLSETCLHFMEDIMTKTGRPNHRWDNYLYLHFGGWDLLMDYVKRDPKRRGYLLRCEEKGYSVSGDRHYFDEALVSNGIVNGTAAAISKPIFIWSAASAVCTAARQWTRSAGRSVIFWRPAPMRKTGWRRRWIRRTGITSSCISAPAWSSMKQRRLTAQTRTL